MRSGSHGRAKVEVARTYHHSSLPDCVTRPPPARGKLESRMDARTRRTVEMSKRVLAFFETHKDKVPADLPPLARLKEIDSRIEQLFTQQRNGLKEVRAA